MNNDTLQALQASIEKWERISMSSRESIYSDNCALCARFTQNCHTQEQERCPVAESPFSLFCNNTPWEDVRDAENKDAYHDFIAASLEELRFLRSLLPERALPPLPHQTPTSMILL